VVREIAERLAGVDILDERAPRHFDVEILARDAGPVVARPAAAARRAKAPLHAEVRERVDSLASDQQHVAAVAAVAAIGSAARAELLPPEADAAITAAAGLNVDIGFVDELHV